MKRTISIIALIAVTVWACSDKGSEPKDKPPADNPLGAPVIDSLSTDRGYIDDSLDIYGKNFGDSQDTASSAMFGSVNAGVIFWTDTIVGVRIPEGAKTGDVSVKVDTLSSNNVSFMVYGINHVEPDSGRAGTVVRIIGAGFDPHPQNGAVYFGNVQAIISYWSDTLIVTTVPARATTGILKIEMLNREYSGGVFIVPGNLWITEIDPNWGPYGGEVIITGYEFGPIQGSSFVRFNGVETEVASWSEVEIVTEFPLGCISGDVIVTTDDQESNPVPFSVFGITNINPTWGGPGDIVTISGTGFGSSQGANYVLVDGITAEVITWSDDSIVISIPEGIPKGELNVVIDGMSSNTVRFAIGLLGLLHQTNCASVVFTGYNCYEHCVEDLWGGTTCDTTWGYSSISISNYHERREHPLVWDGNRFTINIDIWHWDPEEMYTYQLGITGVLSDDGTVIQGINAYESEGGGTAHNPYGRYSDLNPYEINLEFSDIDDMTFRYRLVGPEAEDHAGAMGDSRNGADVTINGYTDELIDTDWENEQYPPEIKITLEYRP